MTFAYCRWPPIGPYFPYTVCTEYLGGVRWTQRGKSDNSELRAAKVCTVSKNSLIASDLTEVQVAPQGPNFPCQ